MSSSLTLTFPPFLWDVESALKPAQCRLVGGTVRDYVLEKSTLYPDYDMATTATPDEVMQRLNVQGIQTVPTGLKHGTVTAVKDGVTVEITTLRKDLKTDGRHAEVTFTEDWYEDSFRRDFTYNAMYLGLDGKLVDFHNGEVDLKRSQTRFIGEPQERVEEDYLRILRYFRFCALYGIPEDFQKTCEEIKPLYSKLKELSAERITAEVLKILMAPYVVDILKEMETQDVLGFLNLTLNSHYKGIQSTHGLWPALPVMSRYYLAFGARVSSSFIRLSNQQKNSLKKLEVAEKMTLPPRALAAATDVNTAASIQAMKGNITGLNEILEKDIPEFPLYGEDVMMYNIPAGPEVGEILKTMNTWWLENGLPERKKCLRILEEMLVERQIN